MSDITHDQKTSGYCLETRNISKQYPGTLAVNNVSCGFETGRIHALLGKNGSGKSTLVNMISGVVKPTAGDIFFAGEKVRFDSPSEAIQHGIAVVHQEMSLINSLSVAENMFLGRLKTHKKGLEFVDWKATEKEAGDILERIQVDISPRAIVSSLSIGQQQQIEIAKALTGNPRLLILDEPTSALALKEVDALFAIMNNLCKEGVTMIYISHRLQELSLIAHTVQVLRDGSYIGKLTIEEATNDRIMHMMFGQVAHFKHEKTVHVYNDEEKPVLSIQNMARKPFFKDISFSLRQGEVLGIAGLLGSGRTELLRSIYGLDPFDSGKVKINGIPINHPHPVIMKKLGISYAPEDRREEGLVQILSSHENLTMASMKEIAYKNFFITRKQEQPYVEKQVSSLHIKVADTSYPVSSLSGGNQQKIVVGNWLNINPKIMFFDEPSRGIDVEAKQQIFQIIWQQKEQKISTLMVSSELEELIEVCDRILVLKDGRISEELYPQDVTINQLYEKV